MGPGHDPPHRPPARHAHRRLAPLRALRRHRCHPRGPEPRDTPTHRGGGRNGRAGLLDAHGNLFRIRRTALRLARLRLLSGDSRLNLDFAEEALGRLGFTTDRKGKRLSVKIPLFRTDVRREDDLVEEVLRVYGYDRLPARLPPSGGAGEVEGRAAAHRGPPERRRGRRGLFETLNYPFVDRDVDEAPYGDWLRMTETALEPLSIKNPLDASRRHLRATLLPGLLDAVARNLRHGASEVALFEVGRTFGAPESRTSPSPTNRGASPSRSQETARSHWSVPEKLRPADFYDARGLVETLLEAWVPASGLIWRPAQVRAFTEGAAASAADRFRELLGIVGLVAGADASAAG